MSEDQDANNSTTGCLAKFEATTWNIVWPWQFSRGKTWTITCGKCLHSWRERLPVAERLSCRCPECGTRWKWKVEISDD